MNEEQSKRLSEAAESILQASEALEEARDAMNDRRFESEQERDRAAAAQQMASRLDNAGKRIEESVRKGTVAAAASLRAGAFARYREAWTAVREGRALAKTAADQDGSANKKARGQEALSRLEDALDGAAAIVFGD
ncbi:MAG: hypothetical protein IT302_00765 [Dehalococcoidia bacterium]|nr:hypothetical protein [Dehalococcoidia bacterium]